MAISDPLRKEVPSAIRQCGQAGIDVKIVTGDTTATAMEIAQQCGIIEVRGERDSQRHTLLGREEIVTGDTTATAMEIAQQCGIIEVRGERLEVRDKAYITGAEFAALSDDEALQMVKGLKVMSRARPTDKQRLVALLQQRGEVVAVTGDGTNDAPALNRAHVGLSLGSGTSVAKD